MPALRSTPKWIDVLAAALLAASLLLLLRPYQGIRHDSILYLGQALAVLYPEPFSHDLFFASGSQANYTLIPRLLAALIAGNDPGTVFKWLVLAGLVAFLAASWILLRTLLPGRFSAAGILALLLLPAWYGAGRILSYTEPFLTGRSFAEPLVLAGLASLVSDRRKTAGFALGVAAVLHPLQTLPALVIAWFWLLQGDRRWLKALWLAIPAIVATLMAPQLRALLTPVDPLWLDQIRQRNTVGLYFITGASNWYNLLTDAFLIALVVRVAAGALRHFCIALLFATLLLSFADLLLAETFHLAGAIALQFWRVHWLTHWAAMALLPWLFQTYRRREPSPSWPRMLVLASIVLFGITPGMAHPLTPGAMLLFATWPWMGRHLGTNTLKLLAIGIACLACLHLFQSWNVPAMAGGLAERFVAPATRAYVISMTAAIVAGIAGCVFWLRLQLVTKIIATLLLLPVLAFAASHWDQRSPLQIAMTRHAPDGNTFGTALKPMDQILWLGGPLPTWNLLHQPNYMDWSQTAGLAFNRGTAIEGMRRREQLHVVDGKGRDCRVIVYPDEPHVACSPDESAARRICDRTRGQLAYLVLPYRLQSTARSAWALANGRAGTYYLYACKDLLAETTSAPAAIPR